ncbi:MAG: orotidine-5'-phosphate decarboxylase [Burkholderiales bacterium]|nr:orotidine-5'-phosphate decarboxylase [Burkholderiales bacterium]
MRFSDMLERAWEKQNSLLCVGLDPAPERFPARFKNSSHPIFDFCKSIVDVTADLVCAFKPQIAYFSSCGAEEELADLIKWIHQNYPDIPVILDVKRGDIGSTAAHYAKEAFGRYEADAVTLSPYMGYDSVEPYLKYSEKGAFILCRTSNQGGDDFQMLDCDGEPLFLRVAEKVKEWNINEELGLVIGGTYPEELAQVRQRLPKMTFLVPGIGAQGGDIGAAVRSGMRTDGKGLVINSSRAILYASQGEDFKERAREEAIKTRDLINEARRVSK